MAVHPCQIVLPECGCDNNPVRNLSSAAPDPVLFVGIKYVSQVPPLGTAWTSVGCVGVCESAISQADADQCAQNQGIECAVAPWLGPVFGSPQSPPVPPPQPTRGNTPYQTVGNDPQTQTVDCPDGNPFSYTTPAGTFVGVNLSYSQALLIANAKAKSYALEQAQARMVCLGGLLSSTCLNQFYSGSITATGANVSGGAPQAFGTPTDDWEIISGMVPPGLHFYGGQVFGGTVIINGTPTMAGTFSFGVRITDTAGGQQTKAYSITVLGISNLPAPAPQVDVAYSYQLNAAGFVLPVFSIQSGSLPTGLTMSAGGLISGTATAAQTATAVVLINDSSTGAQCAQGVTLVSAVGPFKFNINWSNPTNTTFAPATGVPTYTPTGASFATNCTAGGSTDMLNDSNGTPQIMACTLTPCNCHIVISAVLLITSVRVFQNGVLIMIFSPAPPGSFLGTFDVPFNIAAQAHGTPVAVFVEVTNSGATSTASNVSITFTPS